ncbi:hypothetical protein [Polaribacter sp. IC073]|uniref:hypothetical protein n=1 Tax=Polaribacter sp. IC073 TaxID=2508540 RepID=UPI0011BE3E12|nr:hypothetical protein [Polaribacter sp. IC073]TXD47910.1 hypothetical protein ES045_08745 [Polaribacter sp. IC073]
MKQTIKLTVLIFMSVLLTNCATLFGGAVTQSQKTKPKPGEEQRKIRVAALIADLVIFWPSLIVDFATGAIYKPNKKGVTVKKVKKKGDSKMY